MQENTPSDPQYVPLTLSLGVLLARFLLQLIMTGKRKLTCTQAPPSGSLVNAFVPRKSWPARLRARSNPV